MKEKAKVIVIANRKGGCGKTTTAKNLSYDLTRLNKKVLLVDFDPQCNATDGLTNRKYKKSVIGLLKNESINKCIFKTRFGNLDIIPGNDYLASEEVPSLIIKEQLAKVSDDYDYIIIDTSPYFNKLIAEILLAHDLVVIPSEIAEDSLKGMMTTIQELSALCDNKIQFKVLFTKVDTTKETLRDYEELKNGLNQMCFNTIIRYNYIPIKRARKKKIPLSKKYALSKVAKDYRSLAAELIKEDF